MAQSLGSFAADAPRFAIDLASQNGAYYAKADASGTPGGVTSVVGTANQIGVVTTTGTATVSLAAPSPAPTPGTYVNPSVTVDGLGRVTAIAPATVPASVPLFGSTAIQDLGTRLAQFTTGNIYQEGVNGTSYFYNMGYLSQDSLGIIGPVGFTPLLNNHIYRWSMNGSIAIYNTTGATSVTGQWQMGVNVNQTLNPNAAVSTGPLKNPDLYAYYCQPGSILDGILNGTTNASFNMSCLMIGRGLIPSLYFSSAVPLQPAGGADPFAGGVVFITSPLIGGYLNIEDLGLGTMFPSLLPPVVSATNPPVSTRIDVTWTTVGLATANPAPSFALTFSTSSAGPFANFTPHFITEVSPGVFSGYVTQLTPSTPYYIQVVANNGIDSVGAVSLPISTTAA